MTALEKLSSFKLQSTWISSIAKWLSLLKILRKLSLLWRHPSLALLVPLLFTSPAQRLVLFFSPLIGCTLLCLIAFISYGSLMDKIKERETHLRIGDEISGMHLVGSSNSWAEFMDHLHLCKLKPEYGLNSSGQKVNRAMGDLKESDLFNAQGGSNLNEDFGKQTDLSQLIDQAKDKEIPSPIQDEFSEWDGSKRDENNALQVFAGLQGNNQLVREVSLKSWYTGLVNKIIVKEEDGDKREDRKGETLFSEANSRQKDAQNILKEEMEADNILSTEDCNAVFNVAGTDRSNQKHENILISSIENMSMINLPIQTEREIAANETVLEHSQKLDDQSNPSSLQPYSSSKQANANRSELLIPTSDELNMGIDEPHHDRNLADPLDHIPQPYISQKPENLDMIESEILTKGDKAGINTLDNDLNSAAILGHSLQLTITQNTEYSHRTENEILIDEDSSGFEEHDHDHNVASLLNDKPQSSGRQKEEDEQNGIVPQRWRNWVRGMEPDGFSMWTSEDNLFKKVDKNQLCKSFNQETIGVAVMDEDSVGNGAFTSGEGNEGILFENLSAFIQELISQLQSRPGLEEGFGEANSANWYSNRTGVKFSRHDRFDAPGLKLDGFSSLTETLDDSNSTEQGDASSRWDRELDSEKDFLDSENEEVSIWPRPSDASDRGEPFTAKDLKFLKEKSDTQDPESKILSQEHKIYGYGDQWQSAEDGEDSDESFDPYVLLFAQAASTEGEGERRPYQILEKKSTNSSLKITSLKIEERSKSNVPLRNTPPSLHTRGLYRKRRLCCIGRAVRAMRGKLL